MKIDDYITYWYRDSDKIYLNSQLLPVNIRLFRSSLGYKDVVLTCCEYIKELALAKCEDYPLPFGMSGANAAVPFNIIGLVHNRGQYNAHCQIMMNPIAYHSGPKPTFTRAKTNCGSLRLPALITVERPTELMVAYYDEEGDPQKRRFTRENGVFTVHHEIDHNLGILITDRDVNRTCCPLQT